MTGRWGYEAGGQGQTQMWLVRRLDEGAHCIVMATLSCGMLD